MAQTVALAIAVVVDSLVEAEEVTAASKKTECAN